MEGLTIKEMASTLGIPPNTVKQRLFKKGIKPFTKDALYEPIALDAIRDVEMGRPRKAASEPVEEAR
jgi:predicted ArsR family transcriptional regulator